MKQLPRDNLSGNATMVSTSTRLWALFLIATAGCASTSCPSPDELGSRVRVRIASRGDIKSITTGAYRLLLLVRGPDGRTQTFGVAVPEYAESESVGGELGAKIESVYGLPSLVSAESLHAEDPTLVHDFLLPQGYTLDFAPGSFYAYRVAGPGPRRIADREPEIRLGQISADGSRYLELQPSAGPDLVGSEDPPGWPPRD